MIATAHIVRLAIAFCFAAALVLHGAAAQPAPQYAQPKVGQEGKDAIWVPTPEALVETMLDLARVSSADTLFDLGSGDGRMVIAAAKRGATAIGIEFNPDLVALSRDAAAKEGVSEKATFRQADIFATDFSRADVIALFLLPRLNERLRPIILDMKPGTRVVSNTFELGGWRPDETATVQEECSFFFCEALLWIVPAKVGGKWITDRGELTLEQQFQNVTGVLADGKAVLPVSGRLRGEDITLTAGDVKFTGKVGGDTIEGVTASGEKWLAKRGR